MVHIYINECLINNGSYHVSDGDVTLILLLQAMITNSRVYYRIKRAVSVRQYQ